MSVYDGLLVLGLASIWAGAVIGERAWRIAGFVVAAGCLLTITLAGAWN